MNVLRSFWKEVPTCDSYKKEFLLVPCPDERLERQAHLLYFNSADLPECGKHHPGGERVAHMIEISHAAHSCFYEAAFHPQIAKNSVTMSVAQCNAIGLTSPYDKKIMVVFVCSRRSTLPSALEVDISLSLLKDHSGKQINLNRKLLQEKFIKNMQGKLLSVGHLWSVDYTVFGPYAQIKLTGAIQAIRAEDAKSSFEVAKSNVLLKQINFHIPREQENQLRFEESKEKKEEVKVIKPLISCPDSDTDTDSENEVIWRQVNGPREELESVRKKQFEKFDMKALEKSVGGLTEQLREIVVNNFLPRIMPLTMRKAYGTKDSKGILLYGPPGTGKTLTARTIANMFETKNIQIIKGPELLNSFVGQSEANVRAIFRAAQQEWKEKKEESELHVFIFDEIDSLCGKKGSHPGGTGVHDSVLNQLLTIIDGPDALPNILVIGMTNRKDLIDEALLRSGRLDTHIEVGLPDEQGRLAILEIHTKLKRENNLLDSDVNLQAWAAKTENYTGSDLEQLVARAERITHTRNCQSTENGEFIIKVQAEENWAKLTYADFETAFGQIHPAFGMPIDKITLYLTPIIRYNARIHQILDECSAAMSLPAGRARCKLPHSILLVGKTGVGKTALATHMAVQSKIPFLTLLEAGDFAGKSEKERITQLEAVYARALQSKKSVIILDDLEGVLSKSYHMQYFNDTKVKLQQLLTRPLPAEKQLVIIATACDNVFLNKIQLSQKFSFSYEVPAITAKSELEKVSKELKIDDLMAQELLSLLEEKNEPLSDDPDNEGLLNEILPQRRPTERLITIREILQKIDRAESQKGCIRSPV